MKYEYVVVGAGIAGLTMAERIADVLNKKVLVIEKRSHIGGNTGKLSILGIMVVIAVIIRHQDLEVAVRVYFDIHLIQEGNGLSGLIYFAGHFSGVGISGIYNIVGVRVKQREVPVTLCRKVCQAIATN